MSDEFTDQDKAALLALVTRYTRTQLENQALMEERAKLDARLAVGRDQIEKMVGAFFVFGFDMSKPKTKNGFQKLRNLVGSPAYLAALAAAGKNPAETETRDEDGLTPEARETQRTPELPTDADSSSVRDLALEYLNQAGAVGSTASEIREHIEKTRGSNLHSKTVGMTLYRLSQDGLVRREGRTWFAVPDISGKANPGARTPGLKDLLS